MQLFRNVISSLWARQKMGRGPDLAAGQFVDLMYSMMDFKI